MTLVNYFGLEGWLAIAVSLPLWHYYLALGLLVATKLLRVFISYYPVVRGVFSSLARLSNRQDGNGNTGNSRNRRSNRPSDRRSFSTTSKVAAGSAAANESRGMSKELKLTKKNLKVYLKTRVSRFKFALLSKQLANAVFLRNGGRGLINMFKSIMIMCSLSVSSGRMRALVHISRQFYKLASNRGVKGLTLYLKTCAVCLQQSIGEHIVPDPALVSKVRCSRTGTGLPRIIPSLHRRAIRAGDVHIIRMYLSLFNAYRVLEYSGQLKLKSITDGFNGSNAIPLDRYIPIFIGALERLTGTYFGYFQEYVEAGLKRLPMFDIFKSSNASGNALVDVSDRYSTHPNAVVAAARALWASPSLRGALMHLEPLL
jgi:hypothetical protein